jgi:hypothetical protein
MCEKARNQDASVAKQQEPKNQGLAEFSADVESKKLEKVGARAAEIFVQALRRSSQQKISLSKIVGKNRVHRVAIAVDAMR